MIIKRNPQRQKELNKLYSKARVYKTKHHKYKWLVIFGRMPPSIRGFVPALYMKKNLNKNNPTVWSGCEKIVIENQKRIEVKKLPQTHINFLLKEIKYVKNI